MVFMSLTVWFSSYNHHKRNGSLLFGGSHSVYGVMKVPVVQTVGPLGPLALTRQ